MRIITAEFGQVTCQLELAYHTSLAGWAAIAARPVRSADCARSMHRHSPFHYLPSPLPSSPALSTSGSGLVEFAGSPSPAPSLLPADGDRGGLGGEVTGMQGTTRAQTSTNSEAM